LPGPSPGRLCPICDSQIDKGEEKCSFCGTDLSIFEEEIEEAFTEEERLVSETFSELETGSEEADEVPKEAEIAEGSESVEEEEIDIHEKQPIEEKAEEPEVKFECPACGGVVSESDEVCPHCSAIFGEDEEAQFECPACGTLVSADAVRCPGCGALFVEDEEALAETGEESEEVESSAVEMPKISIDVGADISAPKKEARARKAPSEAEEEKPIIKRGGSFLKGLFKGLVSREEVEEERPEPETAEVTKEVSRKPLPEAKRPPKAAEKPEAKPPKARPPKEIPKDPKEQGKELARMVAEVRSLLAIARDRNIEIEESERLIDQAVMAGRERQFIQALEQVSDSEKKLHEQFNEFLSSTMTALKDETVIAKKLGGNPSRANAFIKEAGRATESLDFQAAMVFVDKAKNELRPVTGRFNETREAMERFRKLARDARVIGIDRDPYMEALEEAKKAFDSLEFEKAESTIKKATDNLIAQIPERLNREIENAKQQLIEAKIRSERSISPQITILKSVRWAMKEEKYLDALSEMKRFKKEIRELIS